MPPAAPVTRSETHLSTLVDTFMTMPSVSPAQRDNPLLSPSTLPFGTPQEVRTQVRERIEIFAPGGGYVFNPVHNIQADVAPENIVAVYDAAQRHIRDGWKRTQ